MWLKSKNLPQIKIFILSFLILFIELSLIRFIPSQIRLVGYFTNLILLSTFLGMGVGILSAKRFKIHNLLYTPILLTVLILFVQFIKVEVNITSSDVIFFKGVPEAMLNLEPEIILPIVFIMVALVFIPISQVLGQLFTKLPPLIAYSADILGSLSGVVTFSLLSYFSTPGFIWFILSALILLIFIFLNRPAKSVYLIFSTLLCLILILTSYLTRSNDIWSPYYRITIKSIPNTNMYGVNVNNSSHQFISPYQGREEFYHAPYQLFDSPNYQKILIIGSGIGADVATALGLNPSLQEIDSVEIDPKIAEIGQKLNPDKPFDDPRVKVHINDGRSFLQKSKQKYDLIIYALTDSMVLSNQSANIRLESFLFTKESFELAKNHLTENGLFTMYNYYRQDWLIDKIASMLESVFGSKPYVISYGTQGKAAIFLIGPKSSELANNGQYQPYNPKEVTTQAEDDWPFLYLKNRELPVFFVEFLVVILVISLVLILRVSKGSKFDLRLFMFGAGFMLLETKSLVVFSQLFGTTWLVNSLVICAVLISILIANLISLKFTIKPLKLVFVLMFTLLIISLILPSSFFSKFPTTYRYIIVSAFYFSPLMLANILFSQIFKKSHHPDTSFGSNLLGALVGGVFEYASLIIGYRLLTLVVILFYLLSFIKLSRLKKVVSVF